MRVFKYVFPLAIGLAALIPTVASADIFDWSFGGGSDPVFGSGTLTAVADPSGTVGIYDITSLSGTVTVPVGTYAVTLYPLSAGNGNSNCGNGYGPDCYSTFQNVPGSGGANYTYSNLLYLPGTPGELDNNGIILATAGPAPQAETYFALFANSGADGGAVPGILYDASGANYGNLGNQFIVTEGGTTGQGATTPEPSFGFLALGLLAMIVGVRRWKSRSV